jgi:hypothetical protein
MRKVQALLDAVPTLAVNVNKEVRSLQAHFDTLS